MKIIAYSISNPMTIEMPDKKRKWMDETWNGFAYRCLPLTIANGFGWTVLNSNKFKAVWNGGKEIKDVQVEYENLPDGNKPVDHAVTHFGTGIVTFNLGFIVRTDPGHNLYVKGPANNPKRGVTALEGVVETDWLNFTFTMNWKITEPNYEVVFEKDEPICSFFTYPRNYLESFDAEYRHLSSNPEMLVKYMEYADSRSNYNATLRTNGGKGQRDYLRGSDKEGNKFTEHQNNISAKPFVKIND